MPAEAERLHRRVTGRDRWFLALVVFAVLVGTPLAVVLRPHSTADPSANAGCVTTLRASIMGGATYKYCGADAAPACREFATDDKGLAAQCESLGLLRRP